MEAQTDQCEFFFFYIQLWCTLLCNLSPVHSWIHKQSSVITLFCWQMISTHPLMLISCQSLLLSVVMHEKLLMCTTTRGSQNSRQQFCSFEGRLLQLLHSPLFLSCNHFLSGLNPLDAGRRSTDFAQTPYAAGSLLTDGTVYERSGW